MIQFEAIKRVLQKMSRGIAFGGMFLLIPMMLLTTADVMGRSFFRRPITGTYELSSYLLAVFILLGIAYTYQVGGHVRVTMFVSKLPDRRAFSLSRFSPGRVGCWAGERRPFRNSFAFLNGHFGCWCLWRP
jgi:TRAP-type C4-dicarboxylate transport system permease small subunit